MLAVLIICSAANVMRYPVKSGQNLHITVVLQRTKPDAKHKG